MLPEDLREDAAGQELPGCVSGPHAGWRGGVAVVFVVATLTQTHSPEGLYMFWFLSLDLKDTFASPSSKYLS